MLCESKKMSHSSAEHGAVVSRIEPGFLLFQVLKALHARRGYKKLVMFVDACLAGSMFDGVLPNDMSIYAVTATNATARAFFTYMHSDLFGVPLGALFSSKVTECKKWCHGKKSPKHGP